jgi:hypothetical protein
VTSRKRLHLVFNPSGEVLQEARECEAEVFLQWYGNTRDQLTEEYGGYEPASVFLALAAEDGEVLGAARLISPSPLGLKTLVDVGRPPWQVDGARSAAAAGLDLTSTWDVGTLGVRAGLTGRGIQTAAALYHGLVLAARANRVESFVAILDDRLRRLLLSMGIVLNALPGTSSGGYLGSPSSTPIYAHFGALLDHQRRIAPDAHRLITLGQGLNLMTPDPEAFVLRPRLVDLTEPAEIAVESSVDQATSSTVGGRGQSR